MKDGPVKNASEAFSRGFNCAQAVFSAYSTDLGIEKESALKIAANFGGGMAGLQEVCGAVTGAFMVIGSAYGSPDIGDEAAKKRSYETAREFDSQFRASHGTILCRELLGIDLNTDAGQKEFHEGNLLNTVCAACVRDAAEIVEQLVSERPPRGH